MAIFGVFSKKDKHKHNPDIKAPGGAAASDVDAHSFTTEHSSSPGRPNIVYSGPASASSSKLMLGLRKRKSPQATPSPAPADSNKYLRPPAAGRLSSARSEPGHDILEPPPRKSSLFSSYADPVGARSTRSLPNETFDTHTARSPSRLDTTNLDPDASSSEKKPKGIFSWAQRERKKSKTQLTPSPVENSADSFNLRSFRHIKAEPPIADPSLSPISLSPSSLLPPAISRARVDSVASESSRISVAAFREMAARRSTATSPVPSVGDPSNSLRPPSFLTPSVTPPTTRRSTFLPSSDTSESESEEEDDDDDDSAGSSTLRPKRQNTIKQHAPGKGKGKATSELGHRTQNGPVPARLPLSASAEPARGESIYARPRASVSTSALQPNAASKRASLLGTNKLAPVTAGSSQVRQITRHPSSADDTSSSSESSEDSDDAPLSKLVGPRRPGSSASNQTSASRTRVPSKPLIDISGVAKSPPLVATDSDKPPALPEKEQFSSSKGPPKPSINDRLARLAQSAASKSSDSLQKIPSSPQSDEKPSQNNVPMPTRRQTEPPENLLQSPSPSSPPKLKQNGRSLSSSNAMAGVTLYDEVKNLSDPNPIVPTPIRERSPPPSFSVTSRPPSQLSLNSHTQLNSSTSSTTVQQQQVSTVRIVSPTELSSASTTSSTDRSSDLSRHRPTALIADGGIDRSKGFTGGGLLASNATASRESASRASPKPSPKSSPHPGSGARSRQRASTLAVLGDHGQSQGRAPSVPVVPFGNQQSSLSNTLKVPPDNNSSASSVSTQSSIPPPLKSAMSPRQRGMTAPQKPFAAALGTRGYSPASSTEDSSSGRTPVTPGEGSDISYGRGESVEKGVLSRDAKAVHRKSASVTFDAPEKERGRPGPREEVRNTNTGPDHDESRRKERRRSEAKAAIELGNVVNSRKPLTNDDDDSDDLQRGDIPPRMSMLNPMMGMGNMANVMQPSPLGWQQPARQFTPPQYMMMPQAQDPAFLAAAHQHAMLAAKQAYQFAVAQQAMAAASEEWERGSTAGSAFGIAQSNLGVGGMFPSAPPVPAGYGMGMGMPGAWPGVMFPSGSQSLYAGSVAGSELGVNTNWGSRSVYGEPNYGGGDRGSTYRGSQAGGPSHGGGGRPGPRPRTKTAPSDSSAPAQQRGRGVPPPPTSWRNAPPRLS